jgi:L-gulonate 5-dehydrogenase
VTINPLVTCGTCPPACRGARQPVPDRQIISMPPREGAFASFVAMPERNLVTVPDRQPTRRPRWPNPIACQLARVRLGLQALLTRRPPRDYRRW